MTVSNSTLLLACVFAGLAQCEAPTMPWNDDETPGAHATTPATTPHDIGTADIARARPPAP